MGYNGAGVERRGDQHILTPTAVEAPRIQDHITPRTTGGGYEMQGGVPLNGGGYGLPAGAQLQTQHGQDHLWRGEAAHQEFPQDTNPEGGEEQKGEIEPNTAATMGGTQVGGATSRGEGLVLRALTELQEKNKGSPERVRREYVWQRETLMERGRDKMKNMLLSSLSIQTIAVLPKDQPAPVVKILHSLAVYYSMEEDAPVEVQGKTIGFMGEHMTTKEPVPLILPDQWFNEKKCKFVNDRVQYASYVAQQQGNNKKFWCPTGTRDKENLCRALALPMDLAIVAMKRDVTPCELTDYANGKVADQGSPITEEDVENVNDWALGAGQVETGNNKTPSVAMELKMAMTQHPDFLGWCEHTLDAKLGR